MTKKKKTSGSVNAWTAGLGILAICLIMLALYLIFGNTTPTTTTTTSSTITTTLKPADSNTPTTLPATTATTYPVMPMDNTFLLGYSFQNECIVHEAVNCPTEYIIRVCTDDAQVCYDSPRLNYAYISNTFIQFKLTVEEKRGMLKIFSMNFNSLGCREVEVYIDRTMVGKLYQTGTVPGTEHGWYTLDGIMPSSDILTVTLRHKEGESDCQWGHDIGRVEFVTYEDYANVIDDKTWIPVVHPERGWIIKA